MSVSYATIDSPLGDLFAAMTDIGLVALSFQRNHKTQLLEELQARVGSVREEPRRLDQLRRELDRYFDRRARAFQLPLDWRLAPGGFMRRALEAVATVPFGQTRAYRELAATAGNPGASRAAGTAMARNPIAIVIPCHRALRSDRTIGNYGWGPDGSGHKEYLLRLEGAWPPAA